MSNLTDVSTLREAKTNTRVAVTSAPVVTIAGETAVADITPVEEVPSRALLKPLALAAVVLLLAGYLFAVGSAVHILDHLRRGQDSVTEQLYWAGNLALVVQVVHHGGAVGQSGEIDVGVGGEVGGVAGAVAIGGAQRQIEPKQSTSERCDGNGENHPRRPGAD